MKLLGEVWGTDEECIIEPGIFAIGWSFELGCGFEIERRVAVGIFAVPDDAPIQGTAADIIKVAMIHIFNRFKAEGIRSKMLLQVHDELNFSVYPEEKEKVERIVLEEMQNAFPLSVPLVADSGFGQNWLEAH